MPPKKASWQGAAL
jgi:hypothetical protein